MLNKVDYQKVGLILAFLSNEILFLNRNDSQEGKSKALVKL